MANQRIQTRLKAGVLFLLCCTFGIAAGLLLPHLSERLRLSIAVYYPELQPEFALAIQAAEPTLSQVLVGLGLFGFGGYLLIALTLSGYARSLLQGLVARLREQDLLPYQFETQKKRKGLLSVQEGMHELFDAYVVQLKEAHVDREKFRTALGSYADPTVVEKLRYSAETSTIKSERRPIAVLFSDIRGFTAMSERLEPEQVVMILNDYFTFATEAVTKNGGKVNKFIGDAVMAIFEQPPAYKEEASAPRNAINAALAMQEDFARHIPLWKDRIPQTYDCNLGVGVHFGDAVVGNLGSADRKEYTAIGDTVNFASRLCSLAKPGQVRASEDCFERVQQYFTGLAQEAVAVKGKSGLHATYVVNRKRTF